MFKIAKENLSALFQLIAEKQELYLPVKAAGQTNFAAWDKDAQVDLDTLKTVKSAKDAFFPQSENLYNVTKKEKKMHIEPGALKEQDFVVFGMRACDVKGVEVLDRVFLADPIDSFYAARREHGTIVAMACHEPEETCFCKVFGIDAAQPASDVAAWMIGEDLYWKALTEKGEALTEAVKELLTDADEAPVEEEKEAVHAIVEKLPYMNLSLEGWNGDALKEKFDSPVWEELYKPCLACGTCTFVCPTCQCYDIKDYTAGESVFRYRCWDSCMYSDFTMMAHGNNRNSQMQRFRQRFMHKLVYYPANNDGMYSCVGCGRCVEKCPSALNIVKVVKAFQDQGGEK
ncbi:4Fe-4S dicluster domain-containing protein [Mediterraneibacter agrestimuris]|uniref:4Fe-4S dicluster domain-containing protein n=1 Tax=Mediterraneibacter agrestimuris TaxID=2941333 RepID=UPI00204109B9|nr:4Fe-4S dicluster domain-containing protein [Mediterraneibacter agrestimuris]